MLKYRKLPHGNEKIFPLGLGMGSIIESSEDEIEQVVSKAIANGMNFFDLCCGGGKAFAPIGKATKDCRDKVYFQVHFGAVYNKNNEYGWSRDLNLIKDTFYWELEQLQTDYVDFGFIHCIDEDKDFEDIIDNGILDYVKELKEKGFVKHIGFSSHTPSVSNKVIDTGIIDIMMFSINPAYDLEKGDEYGIGTTVERRELLKKCEALGIGVSVMKPFHGGQLLNASTSPFKVELSKNACIQYCLDRPGVLAVVPGVRSLKDLDELLEFINSSTLENDYSIISEFIPNNATGNCVYCNHCLPCPAHIDIGLINKYYDLSLVGDTVAHNHYYKLGINASSCIKCGHCNNKCPFKVDQMNKMDKINQYFNK